MVVFHPCATILLTNPRYGSVRGNRMRQTLFGLCYRPHAGGRGHFPAGNGHEFSSQTKYQIKGGKSSFYNEKKGKDV